MPGRGSAAAPDLLDTMTSSDDDLRSLGSGPGLSTAGGPAPMPMLEDTTEGDPPPMPEHTTDEEDLPMPEHTTEGDLPAPEHTTHGDPPPRPVHTADGDPPPVPEHSTDEDLSGDDDMRSHCSQHTSAGDSEDEQPCVVADAAVAAPRAVRSVAQDRHIQQLNKFHQWIRNKNAEDDDDGDDDGGAGAEAELFHVRAFST